MLWMCDPLNNPFSQTSFLGNLGVFTSCWLRVTTVIYFTPLKDMQLYIYMELYFCQLSKIIENGYIENGYQSRNGEIKLGSVLFNALETWCCLNS